MGRYQTQDFQTAFRRPMVEARNCYRWARRAREEGRLDDARVYQRMAAEASSVVREGLFEFLEYRREHNG